MWKSGQLFFEMFSVYWKLNVDIYEKKKKHQMSIFINEKNN